MERHFDAIGRWCVDAHSITESDLPDSVAGMRLEAINRYTGRPEIVEIAADLSKGLQDLPERRGSRAQSLLREKHGFSFDYFIGKARSRLVAIVAQGRVGTESEHRTVLDALSDVTLESALATRLTAIVMDYESGLRMRGN